MGFTPNTTVSAIPHAETYKFVRALLERSDPYLLHNKFGEEEAFEKRNGYWIKFRRYEKFGVKTTPLTEGVTPTQDTPSYTDVTAQLKQYGNWTGISDISADTALEAQVAEITDDMGENMGESLDIIYRELLMGGTSVYYANNVAGRTSVVTKTEEADLQAIDRNLFDNKAKYFRPMAMGSQNYGTTTVRPCWIVLAHGDVKKDWEALTGYKSVDQYAGQVMTYESEAGSWNNFRLVLTQNGKVYTDGGGATGAGTTFISTSGSADDVYAQLVFGQKAYKVVPLTSANVESIIMPFGSGGTADPLKQRMTIGWKAMCTLAITQDLNMYRYETAVSI